MVLHLKEIEIKELVNPKDVLLPKEKDAPPFTSEEGWLDKTVESVLSYLVKEDIDKERVPPMALIRCSRGGKTRALKEIAGALKEKQPDLCVIYISLNDYSSIEEWEQDDPTGALCRRIAFAAMKGRDFGSSRKQFDEFLSKSFSPQNMAKWMDGCSCVLLIDELNNLKKLSEKGNSQATHCAQFLKKNFLCAENRYFVFSSHVVTTTSQLSAFMESASSREVVVRGLPIVPRVSVAAENFEWSDLNARQVLFYGGIPALVYEARLDKNSEDGDTHLPNEKRAEAIKTCMSKEKMVSDDSVIRLLRTFIHGDENSVLMPLLQLMNTINAVEKKKVQWIPFHMMDVLEQFSNSCSKSLRLVLNEIVGLFQKFKDAKNQSGDGWESLFVIVLLIRSVTGMFDEQIFPLNAKSFIGSEVWFNTDLNLEEGKNFEDISKVEDLVTRMKVPDNVPCIVVYYPSHNSFEMYDAIVASYDSDKKRNLYGYQLKEGREIPKKESDVKFCQSFVMRGKAAEKSNTLRNWNIVSKGEIIKFFGESGKMWTPEKWQELKK